MKIQIVPFINKLSLVAILGFSGSLLAADYPDRPIGTMVAYGPGGATDFQARIVTMASGKEEFLGQPIYIVNKPGAGGRKGWNSFASKGKKDGYDMAAYNVPHFIAQSIVFKTKYNINNLEPVANWGADPAVFIVPKDSKFNNIQDVVKFAKANPGKVTVSGAGLYVGHHIAFLQFAKVAGIKLKYVPTKGGVAAMKMVQGSQVLAGINNLSDAYRAQDRVKILAVADNTRNKQFLPDIPTFKEQGVAVDNSSVNFRGLMVPKGTPQAVIDKLAETAPRMFMDKKVVKRMSEGGSPLKVMSRDEVISMWKERETYLKDLLKDLKKK